MKTFRVAGFPAVVACAVLIGGYQVVAAQQAQLTRIGHGMATGGFVETHNRRSGFLNDGESATFSVWLQQGTHYVFRGTCDWDCSDLDLELKNARGEVVDSDYAVDAVPEVGVRPRRAGWYHVRVIMASCSIEPCGYAVGTFGR